MTLELLGPDVQQPACLRSTVVSGQQSTGIVDVRDAKIRTRMPGKERRDGPSIQLKRFRALILQMEKIGHPQWRDDQGLPLEKVTQAELARRTGLTPSYLNSIKYPERSRNTDIGAAIVAKLCKRVGLDVRYFYDEYEEERPYVIYLLDKKREQNQADALEKAIGGLRAEFGSALSDIRSEMHHREQAHAAQVATLERELAEARAKMTGTDNGGVGVTASERKPLARASVVSKKRR